jgi:2-amino-4-hydroxy-6-hydroxymethyldihydropteridine diphosphokinase
VSPPGPRGSAVAWVGLGANLGRREAALAELRAQLGRPPLTLEAASRELVTRPVGVRAQPDFLNQVVRLAAPGPLSPAEWLAHCDRAARAAGRRPTYRWGPRRADADVLLLGRHGEVRSEAPEVQVPHPELAARPFLCALLAELDPTLTHPDGWRVADRAGVFRLDAPLDAPGDGACRRAGYTGRRSAS